MDSAVRARRVQQIFEAALALENGDRKHFLDEACGDDPSLCDEVMSLLGKLDEADTDHMLPPLFASTPAPSLVGERLGPYVIVREIAEGGMGAVYLAERDDVDLQVALKLVRYGRLAAPEHVQRFFLERRVLARLNHPHIARLLDAGVTEHRLPYLVMEFVDGEPIDRYCDARRLGIDERLRLFIHVCDAVAYAHRQGVVHRDLKPANLLVTSEGDLKLLDFGIAKLLQESAVGDRSLTRTGALLATPEYASPEQIRGEPVTEASDVYSLGVVLYELLTGHQPYRLNARTVAEIEHAVFTTDPELPSHRVLRTTEVIRANGNAEHITPTRVSEARGTVPQQLRQRLGGDLDEIVIKALSKDPAQRYASVPELRLDLRRHLEGVPLGRRRGRVARPAAQWLRRRARHPLKPALLAAAVVVGLLAAGMSLRQWRPTEPPLPVSAHTVAVLPFAVHGSSEFHYLRAGMMDLVSRGLDGAGELRSVAPELVLAGVGGEPRPLGPGQGRRVSRQVGAGLFVLGTVTEVNGILRVVASLYDDGSRVLARAEVEGEALRLFETVDRLTAELLIDRLRGPDQRIVRTAAAGQHSLPGLKALLEGEEHYRSGRFEAAVEALQRAVAADSTAALAHYRLSTAAMSSSFTEVMHSAAAAAERHGHRLAERDRLIVRGWNAMLVGEADRAEQSYRQVLHLYPDDAEAWYMLGEVLFHLNPYRGRSLREARAAFTHALAADPRSRHILGHLFQLAALERDRGLFESMVEQLRGFHSHDAALVQAPLMRAAVWGDAAPQPRLLEEAGQLSDMRLLVTLWRVTMFSGNLETGQDLARLLLTRPRAPELRAFGHYTLADLALAQGRASAAHRELLEARALEPLRTLQVRALYGTLPFLPVERSELLALRDSLRAAQPRTATPPNEPPFPTSDIDARPALRLYLMALLSLRLGEPEAARRYGREIAALPGTPAERRYSHSMAQSIEARLLHAEGRPAEALAALEAGGMGRTRDYAPAHFAAQGPERFLRAELLFELGRYQEALGWYGTLEEITMADLIYLGPTLLRRGEIHERLGQPHRARASYVRLIELWKNCEPELLPLRQEAERRLARLQSPS